MSTSQTASGLDGHCGPHAALPSGPSRTSLRKYSAASGREDLSGCSCSDFVRKAFRTMAAEASWVTPPYDGSPNGQQQQEQKDGGGEGWRGEWSDEVREGGREGWGNGVLECWGDEVRQGLDAESRLLAQKRGHLHALVGCQAGHKSLTRPLPPDRTRLGLAAATQPLGRAQRPATGQNRTSVEMHG